MANNTLLALVLATSTASADAENVCNNLAHAYVQTRDLAAMGVPLDVVRLHDKPTGYLIFDGLVADATERAYSDQAASVSVGTGRAMFKADCLNTWGKQ